MIPPFTRAGTRSFLLWMVAVACAFSGSATPAAGQATGDDACLTCHAEPEFLRSQVTTSADARRLHVQPGPLRSSTHGDMTCAECHTSFARFPHPEAAETVTCATSSCHTADPHPDWETSVHSRIQDDDNLAAADCASCHGVHDVASLDDLQVEGGPDQQRMNSQCVSCHLEQAYATDDPHADSTSCAGCHAPHAMQEAGSADSRVAPGMQVETCGACHEAAADSSRVDIHGMALHEQGRTELVSWPPEQADSVAPTCSDCHGAHPMPGTGHEDFQERMIGQCATCHTHAADTYYDTYHGKATRLGSGVAASCAQCHGAHGVLPPDSTGSYVHADNLVATCGECHEAARPAFVLYNSHPDTHDREGSPILYWSLTFMHALLIGTLGVFGLHTILWWIRIWLDSRKAGAHGGTHG